ncbi:MAG: hypothetical protein HDR30_01905 [Lachnospiraceae bacterium]|nr:hypothetical protein [Lachnospiraceae bacterium]
MYWKEIIYMSLFEDEIKKECVGYLKSEKKQDEYQLEIQVKKIPMTIAGSFPIRIQSETGWQETGMLVIKDGCGKWSGEVKEAVIKAEIIVSDSAKIKGESKKAAIEEKTATVSENGNKEASVKPQETSETQETIETQEMPETQEKVPQEEEHTPALHAESMANAALEKPVRIKSVSVHKPLYENKWEQLLSTYERIHPYGDNRIYVKLEPKDFIVLRENYQHLVNNSFLLHGFYNYRYLILGKEGDFYLGVPGVFYEREKMVALMFGFEAFECEGGEAEEGKFGYYLRKVEL